MAELAYDDYVALAAAPAAEVVQLRPEPDLGALLDRAQELCDENRPEQAAALLAAASPVPAGDQQLLLRALLVESWLDLGDGRLDAALERLQRARAQSESPACSDVDRAETLFRLAACHFKRSSTATAISLLTLALELCDRTALPCDRVRAHALVWRARCWQRQRDWEAARADVERALELAEGLADDRTSAHATFQASLIAEREGQWLLARYYAEEARRLYLAVGDRLNVGRLTNNLGCLTFLLGCPEEAARLLEEAHAVAIEVGSDADTAQALASLAQVHLRSDEPVAAEREARAALELLSGRLDFVDEIGDTQLVLGRALLEQDRLDEAGACFHAASQSFDRLGSISHRAAVWVAQGDLTARRGDSEGAAALYRRAAESLQDFHF